MPVPVHSDENWTVARAASVAGLKRSRFQQCCHQELGRGFTDWLIEQRVARAVTLLRDRHLSIDEVAASCGFRSRSTFFRHLRLRSGRSPEAWRNCRDNS
ncbi:MAG: helix-turn-helix transcriptional regulator [Planctomycetota bacterium]